MKAKRIFAGLSALTLATAMLTVSAFASEAPERTEIKPNDSGNPDPNPASTTVTYSVDPGYIVTIPTAVKLSDKNNVNDAVSASEVRLLKGSKIVVSLADTNDFKLYNGGASIDYQVSNTAGKLAKGDTVKEFTADGSETLTFAKIDKETVQYAGDYTGSLVFDIAVESGNTMTLTVNVFKGMDSTTFDPIFEDEDLTFNYTDDTTWADVFTETIMEQYTLHLSGTNIADRNGKILHYNNTPVNLTDKVKDASDPSKFEWIEIVEEEIVEEG